jgi:hypothetical protein
MEGNRFEGDGLIHLQQGGVCFVVSALLYRPQF